MAGFKCRSVPVGAFNRLGSEHGVLVRSRDGKVDGRDAFELHSEGQTKKLRYKSQQVQSILRIWRGDCSALKRRTSSREMKKLARAFRVSFGLPAVGAEGDSERLGVYRKGKHLFDVDAADGGSASRLTVRQLARLLARELDAELPPHYRARVSISDADRERLGGMGVSVDESSEMLKGASGESFHYGGNADVGYTEVASIEIASETSLRITMRAAEGEARSALLPLKPIGGDSSEPVEAKPTAAVHISEEEGEDDTDDTVRPPAERGQKKRTIRGPGISITVYE